MTLDGLDHPRNLSIVRIDVESRAKGRSGPGENNRTGKRSAYVVDNPIEGRPHRLVKCVPAVWAIQGDQRDMAFSFVKDQIIIHAFTINIEHFLSMKKMDYSPYFY